MSSRDRQPFLTSVVLDQTFLNYCHDNLTNQLELVVDIETPDGVIHASDRNKYVGDTFYEALLTFPVIDRTLGEWLSNTLEFSVLTLELSNADARFNKYVPGGALFGGWIGKMVEVRLGLRDVESTYRTIFRGTVTEVGGFKRSVKSITIIARDIYDKLNEQIPTTVFSMAAYPFLEDEIAGLGVPVIQGDWSTNLSEQAVVPAFVVNGANSNVIDGTRINVQCVVTEQPLDYFDATNVYLERGTALIKIDNADVVNVGVNKNNFQVVQNGATMIDGAPYLYSRGDRFFCRVRAGSDNIVTQARWLLETFGGLTAGDFDANWSTFATALSAIKSRVWIQTAISLMEYVLSLFEQVRLEVFVSIDQKLKINSLRFENFVANPSYSLTNWDVERETFTPQIEEQNNFNRAQGSFSFEPKSSENALLTGIYRNSAAITQAGKPISKAIVFPNLYIASQVVSELSNIIRLASAYSEQIELNVTWRSLLLEPGNFVKLNVAIGASVFENVPCIVRRISYIPDGLKIGLKLWSLQMVPFTGWTPSHAGIVGGATATITLE